MNERQRQLSEDLSGIFRGEVRCDPLMLAAYASDASIFQVSPLGVARPVDRDDVVVLARYAAETGTPLIARGAGTGVAGAAIGEGLIVDFSRHMTNVESIGAETVRVQPGVVRDRLNQILRPHGRYFPPDPSNTAVTTVGGMLAVDAAGSHSIRVGSVRDHVASIETVLAGGTVLEFGEESLSPAQLEGAFVSETSLDAQPPLNNGDAESTRRSIVERLAALLIENRELISRRQPPLIRNAAGYYLRGVLAGSKLSVPRLLVGSEGTLGLFTAATLHTSVLPPHRSVALLLFGDLESAIKAVQEISDQEPSACDLMDRRLLSLAREADPRFEQLIAPAAEVALIVEQIGFSDAQCRDRIQMVIRAVRALNVNAVVAYQAHSFEEVEFLWTLPGKVVPLLTRLKGQTRPTPIVEDISVPSATLLDFLRAAQKVFQNHQVTASLYSHAAAGQLHLRPFLAPPSPLEGPKLEALAHDLYAAVFAVGGTVSGEHGDGMSRTAFLRTEYGQLYRVFEDIKQIFDPKHVLNPGKIVANDVRWPREHIRPSAPRQGEPVALQLRWTERELLDEALTCNGCGQCKTQSAGSRMCPFFRIESREEASPRSKANVLRDYLTGRLDPREWTSESMKEISDLCFNCKQCQLECPTNVNIPQMMIEAKAAQVAAHGVTRADWILSRAHSYGWLGSTASLAMNWAIANPAARWCIEQLVGISRRRKLPLFARRSFLSMVRRGAGKPQKSRRGRTTVVYFAGDYVNYHDPQLGQALLAILEHNGIAVYVPPAQTSSGMAMISAGDLEAARIVADQNVRELAELAREGYPILCTEPTAALCLKQEYSMILDHPDVAVLASQVVDAGAYLRDLHNSGKLKTDFRPLDLDVAYHTPCHLKALECGTPLADLLSLIPQLRLHRIEKGCSGMAGAYGLTERNFRTSIRIGWELITAMRNPELDAGATECSGCKFQMEQGTETPTVHPLKLLAYSYGLMPEIESKLQRTKRKLVAS
ncbi:MAG TPA: anaerobic glycerol-3-phosphate dehydrogenase subunit C [Planctomycetaceae bacterium]|nr:anaerobic glycerol-3-phosphate dehydrogenase subunit C [Planctomycetaceae bacterium]